MITQVRSRPRRVFGIAALVAGSLVAAPIAAASAARPTVSVNPPLTSSAPVHVGGTLAAPLDGADASAWTGGPKLSVQWYRCVTTNASSCTKIAGATKDDYPVTKADIDDYLEAVVIATNAEGSTTKTSPMSALVRNPLVPMNSEVPTISPSGIAPLITSSLHASPGTWTGAPTSYDFQWVMCSPSHVCHALTPESSTVAIVTLPKESTLSVPTAWLGDTIEVQVAAINKYGASPWATSKPTKPVTA